MDASNPSRRAVMLAGAGAALAPHIASAASPDPFAIETIAADLAFLDGQAHLRTGGAGELALAARLADRLEAAGFDLSRQALRAPFFEPRRSALALDSGEVEISPQFIVTQTGPDGIEAPLHFWRLGDDAQLLKDKIAIVMLAPGRHSQLLAPPSKTSLEAALAGAPAAIVLITEGVTGETIILNAPFDKPVAAIPIAVLGPKPGSAVIAAAKEGKRARLIIDGEAGWRDSFNLIGRIHRAGARHVVISTPRTGWTPAVAERGPGIAAWRALAAWAPQGLRQHSLTFISTAAHEFDNAGGLQFLTSADCPSPRKTALWLHLGAGFAGRDLHVLPNYLTVPLPSVDAQRFLVGSEEILPILRAAFAGQPGLEAPYPASAGGAGELVEVLHAGYRPAFGLLGGHWRHHMMSDRLAMTDPSWVRAAALAAKSAAEQILNTDRTP